MENSGVKQWIFEAVDTDGTVYRRTIDVVTDAGGFEVGTNETPYLPV